MIHGVPSGCVYLFPMNGKEVDNNRIIHLQVRPRNINAKYPEGLHLNRTLEMVSTPRRNSFVSPEMEDISPSGVWSSDQGAHGSTPPDVEADDNGLSEDEAAPKDEKLTWPFKKLSELAKSAKGKVTQAMLQFIQKQ